MNCPSSITAYLTFLFFFVQSHWVANYVRLKLNEPIHLYDFALIVGIRLDEDKKCHPQVLFQYPEKVGSMMPSMNMRSY